MRRVWAPVVLVATLVLAPGAAAASAPGHQLPGNSNGLVRPAAAATEANTRPLVDAGENARLAAAPEQCQTSAEGSTRQCVGPVTGKAPATKAAPPERFPSYCQSGDGVRRYLRNEACRNGSFYYRVLRQPDQTELGRTTFNYWEYTFFDTQLNSYRHELAMTVLSTSPRTVTATVSGTPFHVGNSCVTLADSIQIAPTLLTTGANADGQGHFRSTATAVGAVGTCTAQWTLTFKNPGVSDFFYTGFESMGVRCDNAVGGSPRRVGCVIPQYPQAVFYSLANMPNLGRHVLEAQGSGLPGGTMASVLTRSDAATNEINRNLACGDGLRPSIPGLSCDEYPLASSQQGMARGGARRSIDNCNFDNLPRATGPTGVSVCMVPAGENDIQGGIQSQFFYQWRVLTGDPWRVVVTP